MTKHADLNLSSSSNNNKMPREDDQEPRDTHLQLVELSCQVMCVLLDCGTEGVAAPVATEDTHQPCVPLWVPAQGGFNLFRTLLARLHVGTDLTLVYQGLTRLLRSVYEAESNYTSLGSKLGCYQELLVLFWKCLEENQSVVHDAYIDLL